MLKSRSKKSPDRRISRLGRAALGVGAAGLVASLAGCTETDAWLLDPSVVGRWEWTPTTVPILRRITSIEGPEDEFVEISEATQADLLPEVFEYRIGPGDRMIVEVFDIPQEGDRVPHPRVVDARGFITIPQLGEVYVAGHTVPDAEAVIADAMRPLVSDPLVSVIVDHQRQRSYTAVGAVQVPGMYNIPVADYRLHEALAAAGGFSEAPEYIYVIRRIPLSEAVGGRPTPVRRPGEVEPAAPTPDRIIDIIEEIRRPEQPGRTPPGERRREDQQPDEPRPEPAPPPPGEPPPEPETSPGVMRPRTLQPEQPPVDLIENNQNGTRQRRERDAATADSNWIFLDGEWVRVQRRSQPSRAGIPGLEEALGRPEAEEPLVTQRVIRIPTRRLASGDQRYNIIVRPHDIIRVPPPPTGLVYLMGQVSRVGSYGMADGLTLRRAISAAGGFNAVAIPERIDLTRMVGADRQATIRLNGRAIWQGTHPDIFLKANDEINVGTSFWATPMAVIRNGFRTTYGFGFLLDRNFGNDVFGAPPTRFVQ